MDDENWKQLKLVFFFMPHHSDFWVMNHQNRVTKTEWWSPNKNFFVGPTNFGWWVMSFGSYHPKHPSSKQHLIIHHSNLNTHYLSSYYLFLIHSHPCLATKPGSVSCLKKKLTFLWNPRADERVGEESWLGWKMHVTVGGSEGWVADVTSHCRGAHCVRVFVYFLQSCRLKTLNSIFVSWRQVFLVSLIP